MVSVEPVSCCSGVAPAFVLLFMIFGIFIGLIALAIKVLIFCSICSKAGYSWALGLLILVPIANIIIAFYIAFADWPIQKELRHLKQQQAKPQT